MFEMDLGVGFSIQISSKQVDAVFWLSINGLLGVIQCITVGENPSIVENDLVLELKLSFRL
jgi:hypothetical protein